MKKTSLTFFSFTGVNVQNYYTLIFTFQVGNGALYSVHTKKEIFMNSLYITKFKLCTAQYRVECTQYLLYNAVGTDNHVYCRLVHFNLYLVH